MSQELREKFAEFVGYNIQDVLTQAEVSNLCPPLSDYELKVWQLDQVINNRGVCVDMVTIEDCLWVIDTVCTKGDEELRRLTMDPATGKPAVNTIGQVQAIGMWVEANSKVKLPRTKTDKVSLTAAAVEKALKRKHMPDKVREVLVLRQKLGLSSVKKLFPMLQMADDENRVRGIFQYYGALRTGRWSGRGIQPHNLKKPGDLETVEHTFARFHVRNPHLVNADSLKMVADAIRGMFVSAPGKELICSDYNAIEAVVLAEIAEETWRQEVFRTHGKIYEMSASKITGLPFEEFAEYKRINDEHHPYRGSIGKVAELASGFGGWINAWKNFGADKHFKTDEEIKEKIIAWRDESPKIVELWGGQQRKNPHMWHFTPELFGAEGAVVRAISQPGVPFPIGRYVRAKYDKKLDVLNLILPSGRKLYYQQPRLEPIQDEWSGLTVFKITFMKFDTGALGWHRSDTYGGRLVENMVQAIARDLLADAMLNVEAAGYPIVLHVHDEIVSEVPIGFGSIKEYEEIMARSPEWAKDWPVRASGGWRGRRYRK